MTKNVGVIFSIGNHWEFGKDGDLCFKTKNDLTHFKNVTINSTLVMGWNTFVSLGMRSLSNRESIVVTSKDIPNEIPNVTFVKSITDAINNSKTDDVWLIGGVGIIQNALLQGLVNHAWITYFDATCDGKDIVYINHDLVSLCGLIKSNIQYPVGDDTVNATAVYFSKSTSV